MSEKFLIKIGETIQTNLHEHRNHTCIYRGTQAVLHMEQPPQPKTKRILKFIEYYNSSQ